MPASAASRRRRTFRADRVRPLPPTGLRFVPREPPGGDAAAHVLHGVRSLAWAYQARIRVRAPASVVAERSTPTSGQITPIDDATCELVTGTDSLHDLATYLTSSRCRSRCWNHPNCGTY